MDVLLDVSVLTDSCPFRAWSQRVGIDPWLQISDSASDNKISSKYLLWMDQGKESQNSSWIKITFQLVYVSWWHCGSLIQMKWRTEIVLHEWLLILFGKGHLVKRLAQSKNAQQQDALSAFLKPSRLPVVKQKQLNLDLDVSSVCIKEDNQHYIVWVRLASRIYLINCASPLCFLCSWLLLRVLLFSVIPHLSLLTLFIIQLMTVVSVP